MRVKLFWKNDRGILNDLYKDGTFRNWKDCWKDWWSGKTQLGPRDGWQEELSLKKSQELETEINNWLSQNPKIKVVDIKQSASGGSTIQAFGLFRSGTKMTPNSNVNRNADDQILI
jgi:hypothetical protein